MKNKVKISSDGSMLIYKRGYKPAFVFNYIKDNNLEGLRIFDHFDPLDNLNFLSEYVFLNRLVITCMKDHDYSFLKHLKNLKSFALSLSVKNDNLLDLTELTNLEYLSLAWRKNIKGLENCKKLRTLCIWEFNELDLEKIKELKNLKELVIKTASIENLNGIEDLKSLENVILGNCRKLRSIKGIEALQNLKKIEFDACTKIVNFDALEGLKKLERLEIVNCKEIDSIGFVKNMKSLKELSLLGNTTIKDADMIPAKDIEDVVYVHKKNYNIRIRNERHEELTKKNRAKLKEIEEEYKKSLS